MVLVESRGRKAAFLREAVRQLELADVRIEHARLESLASSGLSMRPELALVRAVRMDRALLDQVRAILAPAGRLFWFRSAGDPPPDSSIVVAALPLGSSGASEVAVLKIRS
jgi:16S rRNA G527 N7-methylase RsmG